MVPGEEILDQFLGTDDFPVTWASEDERRLFWVYDDLHCPQPLSPMFFDIGGWGLTCDHMFRRFCTPFAVDWLWKNVNGYLYSPPVSAAPGPFYTTTEHSHRYCARAPSNSENAHKL